MVGTREEPGHEAALLDAEGLRHRLVATEVDHEAEGFEGERPPLALPERGGHVARDVVALAHGVLGGRGAPAVGVGGVGDRCAVADRPDVLASLDLRALVDPDPALLVQRSRGRGYPRCPNDGPRRHLLAGGELDAGFRDPLQPRSRPHLDAAPPELGGREPREVLGYLAHDPVVRLHQQPAGPLGGAARVQVEYLRRQILHLRDRLDSRVAAAGDHEGEVLLADDRVVDRLGHLEVPQQRVAHVERLDDALEPHGPLAQPWDRQVSGHGPERHDELVVRELDRTPLDRDEAKPAAFRVAIAHAAEQEVRVPELFANGQRHVPRVDRASRHGRQQRGVEEEVRLADDRDLGAVPREPALEGAHRVEAAEAASRHHHLPGHQSRTGVAGCAGRGSTGGSSSCTSFSPSMSRLGIRWPSPAGSHQARRSRSASTAGTSVIRTRKASTSTPNASAKPIDLMTTSSLMMKPEKTAIMISPAAVTTRALAWKPLTIASCALPVWT